MIEINYPLRHAVRNDAIQLAELANMAGEGLPLYLWGQMAESGQTAWDVGRSRAQREEGFFSYRNAIVRLQRREIAACLVGYPLEDKSSKVDYSEIPPILVPLQELEDMASATWYINILAVYPRYRGKGYGSDLLALAEDIATGLGKSWLSLIIADTNLVARRLYEQQGYREKASRAMIKNGWQHPGSQWVLLVKSL